MAIALITDPEILAGYLTDASNVQGRAEGLVRPQSAEEVAEVVRHCQAHDIPLTVTAGRTSTTASAVPEGGWLLSTEGLTEIGAIEHHRATAQAGVRLGEFQAEIEARGRFYPPDPTSRMDCTLGASIACNASGARSFRYGPTRHWIESLRVVLANGEIVDIHRDDAPPADWPLPHWQPPSGKSSAGYHPGSWLDLMIGQEGTLGVIVEATVRLTDLVPFVGLMAFFPSRRSAVSFMEHARREARTDLEAPCSPRCVEYLDHHCLELASQFVGTVPHGARAALFCEQELSLEADQHLEGWLEALSAHEALVDDTIVADDPRTQERLHALRHAVPAGINETIVRNGMPKVGTDLAVPDEALGEMMDLYEATPLPYALFGHIADNHLHLNVLPRTEAELMEARAHYDRLAQRAIALGGTVSAEHGIGKLKRQHLAWMVGPEVIDRFRALKTSIDPNGILGRGNILPRAESL